jgi:potassium voltage-gated channel Shab-related subfamily B protein 2
MESGGSLLATRAQEGNTSSKLRLRGAQHLCKEKKEFPRDPAPEFDPHIDGNISIYMPHQQARPMTLFISPWLRCTEADYYALFQQLDIDRVGAFRIEGGDLTKAEIEIVLRKFGLREQQLVAFFRNIALDADGCITFVEFMAVMRSCMDHERDALGFGERIYLNFEDPSCCLLAKYISLVTTFLIVLSTAASVIESLPFVYSDPTGCGSIQQLDEGHLCAPTMDEAGVIGFYAIEAICVVGFTIDYLLRFGASPFVRQHVMDHAARTASVAPVFHFDADMYGERKQAATSSFYFRNWKVVRLLRFTTKTMNFIDFVAIFPFYAAFFISSDGADGLLVLRLLRLGRVLRLLKLGKKNESLLIFAKSLERAAQSLAPLIVIIVIICIPFGSFLYMAEGGSWMEPHDICDGEPCSEQWPKGAYLRQNVLASGLEETPYRSLMHACWYVLVTILTVGYGDMLPTSISGKCIASACMVVGLLVVALPLSVFAGAYVHEVEQHQASKYQAARREKQGYKLFLKNQLHKCHQGSIREQQLSYKYGLVLQAELELIVPGGCAADHKMLALAQVHKDIALTVAEMHEMYKNKFVRLNASIGAVCNAVGVPCTSVGVPFDARRSSIEESSVLTAE